MVYVTKGPLIPKKSALTYNKLKSEPWKKAGVKPIGDLQGGETTAENYQLQNFPGTMAIGWPEAPEANWLDQLLAPLETKMKKPP